MDSSHTSLIWIVVFLNTADTVLSLCTPQNTCVGMNNFSGERNAGSDAGTTINIRLDCDNGKVTYITRHGERECDLECNSSMLLYPVIDSDENGIYKIERVGKAKGGGNESVKVSTKMAALIAHVGVASEDFASMPLLAAATATTAASHNNNNSGRSNSSDIKALPVKPWWKPSLEAKSPVPRLLSSSSSSSALTLPPAQLLTEARERGRQSCALLLACLPLAPPNAVDHLAFSDPITGSNNYSSSNVNSPSAGSEPGLLAALVKQLAYGAAAEVAAAARVLTVLLMHRDPSVFCGAFAASVASTHAGPRAEGSASDADHFLDVLFGLVASGQLASGAGLGQRVHSSGSGLMSGGFVARRPFEATVTAAAEATALLRLLLGSRPGVHVATPTALPPPPPSGVDGSNSLGAPPPPPPPPLGLMQRQLSAPAGGGGSGESSSGLTHAENDVSSAENDVSSMPPKLQRSTSTNDGTLHRSSSNNSTSSAASLNQSGGSDWRSMILARLADGISVRLHPRRFELVFSSSFFSFFFVGVTFCDMDTGRMCIAFVFTLISDFKKIAVILKLCTLSISW